MAGLALAYKGSPTPRSGVQQMGLGSWAAPKSYDTFSKQHREQLVMGGGTTGNGSSKKVSKTKARITVVVRKRPLSTEERAKNELDILSVTENDASIVVNEPRRNVCGLSYVEPHGFTFDRAYSEFNSNRDIYVSSIRQYVDAVFQQNARCACFAYGQTGSGKTYTMVGSGRLLSAAIAEKASRANPDPSPTPLSTEGAFRSPLFSPPGSSDPGLLELAAQDCFEYLRKPEFEYHLGLYASFFEIYCNKVYDLLNGRRLVRALETSNSGAVVVKDLKIGKVNDLSSLLNLISTGLAQRIVGINSKNNDSSRGHAVLTFDVRNEHSGETSGKLVFVDLAGSERGVDAVGAGKQTQTDGAGINRSLLALKECIRALDQQNAHVPFRDSELTKVLRDMFVGSSTRTLMISCVSPSASCCEQTLNTLRYADRVKAMRRNGRTDDDAQPPPTARKATFSTGTGVTLETPRLPNRHERDSAVAAVNRSGRIDKPRGPVHLSLIQNGHAASSESQSVLGDAAPQIAAFASNTSSCDTGCHLNAGASRVTTRQGGSERRPAVTGKARAVAPVAKVSSRPAAAAPSMIQVRRAQRKTVAGGEGGLKRRSLVSGSSNYPWQMHASTAPSLTPEDPTTQRRSIRQVTHAFPKQAVSSWRADGGGSAEFSTPGYTAPLEDGFSSNCGSPNADKLGVDANESIPPDNKHFSDTQTLTTSRNPQLVPDPASLRLRDGNQIKAEQRGNFDHSGNFHYFESLSVDKECQSSSAVSYPSSEAALRDPLSRASVMNVCRKKDVSGRILKKPALAKPVSANQNNPNVKTRAPRSRLPRQPASRVSVNTRGGMGDSSASNTATANANRNSLWSQHNKTTANKQPQLLSVNGTTQSPESSRKPVCLENLPDEAVEKNDINFKFGSVSVHQTTERALCTPQINSAASSVDRSTRAFAERSSAPLLPHKGDSRHKLDISRLFPRKEKDDILAAATLIRKRYKELSFPISPVLPHITEPEKSISLSNAISVVKNISTLPAEDILKFYERYRDKMQTVYEELIEQHVDCFKSQTAFALSQQRMLRKAQHLHQKQVANRVFHPGQNGSGYEICLEYIAQLRKTIESELALYARLGKRVTEMERMLSLQQVVFSGYQAASASEVEFYSHHEEASPLPSPSISHSNCRTNPSLGAVVENAARGDFLDVAQDFKEPVEEKQGPSSPPTRLQLFDEPVKGSINGNGLPPSDHLFTTTASTASFGDSARRKTHQESASCGEAEELPSARFASCPSSCSLSPLRLPESTPLSPRQGLSQNRALENVRPDTVLPTSSSVSKVPLSARKHLATASTNNNASAPSDIRNSLAAFDSEHRAKIPRKKRTSPLSSAQRLDESPLIITTTRTTTLYPLDPPKAQPLRMSRSTEDTSATPSRCPSAGVVPPLLLSAARSLSH